jgi:hypothetical protein
VRRAGGADLLGEQANLERWARGEGKLAQLKDCVFCVREGGEAKEYWDALVYN